MSSIDLVEQGILSLKAYNHIMGLAPIDFDYYRQPDSIYRLKTHLHPPTHRITIDGYILDTARIKYIIKSQSYLFKFLLGDETDNIWVCLWFDDKIFPYFIYSFPKGSRHPTIKEYIKISNASLVKNDYHNCFELSINSFDNISFS